MRDLTDAERLRSIVKALQFCEQAVTEDALRTQFRYETGRQPDAGDLRRALGGRE